MKLKEMLPSLSDAGLLQGSALLGRSSLSHHQPGRANAKGSQAHCSAGVCSATGGDFSQLFTDPGAGCRSERPVLSLVTKSTSVFTKQYCTKISFNFVNGSAQKDKNS